MTQSGIWNRQNGKFKTSHMNLPPDRRWRATRKADSFTFVVSHEHHCAGNAPRVILTESPTKGWMFYEMQAGKAFTAMQAGGWTVEEIK
jgi:hypothetical protein